MSIGDLDLVPHLFSTFPQHLVFVTRSMRSEAWNAIEKNSDAPPTSYKQAAGATRMNSLWKEDGEARDGHIIQPKRVFIEKTVRFLPNVGITVDKLPVVLSTRQGTAEGWDNPTSYQHRPGTS